MNRIELTAQLIERGVLRYTPAGLPALDLRLSHTGDVTHLGAVRKVRFEVHATVVGDEVRKFERTAIGTMAVFHGFLGKLRNGQGLMMHIQGFDPLPPVTTDPTL